VTDQQILEVFTTLLRDLLVDDSIVLRMDTVRADVAGWDSFAYLNFIVAVEMKLGIKFKVAEIESFETVGDIVAGARSLLG
jgi:acyl carrier protein